MGSVLHQDVLLGQKGIRNRITSVEVLFEHVDGGDSAVFVGGVVVDAAFCIAAGGVDRGDGAFVCLDAAADMTYAGKNMETLADALRFG